MQIPSLFAWRSEAREGFEVRDRALARPPEAATALAVVLCAGHGRQLGGASPLCNLMEVKH